VLDRWIINRLRETVIEITKGYESYIPLNVAEPAEAFLDDLSNWYVRRSRRRFWAARGQNETLDANKEAAYQTLYAVLVNFIKLLAPVMPFMTETIYQNLVRSVDDTAPESVHHCLFPTAEPLTQPEKVAVDAMSAVRQAATLGHSVRSSNQLKVRQPLARALIAADPRRRQVLNRLLDLLADELNVKEVQFVEEEGELVNYKLLPVNRILGPKFGRRFPQVRKALTKLAAAAAVARLNEGESLQLTLEDGTEVALDPDEVLVRTEAREGYGVASEGGLVVALDTDITPELAQEGLAREVIRRIQELRKQADYELTDRIIVEYEAEGALAEAIDRFEDEIADEVLAASLDSVDEPTGDERLEADEVDGHEITLAVKRLES
jgi:isoleucyl-tRNA synthetase